MDSRQESSFGVVDMVIDSVRAEVDGGFEVFFFFFLACRNVRVGRFVLCKSCR